MSPSGAVHTYTPPGAGSAPPAFVGATVLGGTVWYRAQAGTDEVLGITPGSPDTVLTVPSGGQAVVAGSDGSLWVDEPGPTPEILRVSVAGTVTGTFAAPVGADTAMTLGPDGAVWFTEPAADAIGRITTDGVVTSYPVPLAGSGLDGITVGPDGNIWFTQRTTNTIGVLVLASTGLPLVTGAGALAAALAAGIALVVVQRRSERRHRRRRAGSGATAA